MSMRPPRKDNLRKSWPSPSPPKYFDVTGDGKIIVTKYSAQRRNLEHVNLLTLYKAYYVFVIEDWNSFQTSEEFWAEDNWPKTVTVVKDRFGDFGVGLGPEVDEDDRLIAKRPVISMTRNDFMKLLLAV